jgi:hypothetical protein
MVLPIAIPPYSRYYSGDLFRSGVEFATGQARQLIAFNVKITKIDDQMDI